MQEVIENCDLSVCTCTYVALFSLNSGIQT